MTNIYVTYMKHNLFLQNYTFLANFRPLFLLTFSTTLNAAELNTSQYCTYFKLYAYEYFALAVSGFEATFVTRRQRDKVTTGSFHSMYFNYFDRVLPGNFITGGNLCNTWADALQSWFFSASLILSTL